MASAEAKPASPAAADPPADDAKENADPEPETMADSEDGTKQEEEQKTPQQPEKKRGWRKRGEAEADKKTPTPGIERPSRERKTVERYAELAPRVTPAKKSPAILQVSKSSLLSRSTLICCLRMFFPSVSNMWLSYRANVFAEC
jgi:protein DEK